MRRYTLILDPDEDGIYTVTVPALPGVVTQGDTIDEALVMAREAIELHISGLVDDGEQVPHETRPPVLVAIDVAIPEHVATESD